MKRLALLTALLCLAARPPARAEASEDSRLTEPEIIELSLKTLAGERTALRRLKREYRHYRRQLGQDEPVTDRDLELMREIEDTLGLTAPGSLDRKTAPPGTLPGRSIRRSDFLRYLDFREGDQRVYEGSGRALDRTAWDPDGKTLRQHTVEIVRKQGHRVRVKILQEVLTLRGQWIAEQSFLTFWVLPDGLRMEKEVVFSQPEPGRARPVGALPEEILADFPIVEGRKSGAFIVEDASATVRSPAGVFAHCAAFRGLSEKFVFAPQNGLVLMESGEQRWTLREKKIPEGPVLPPRPKPADRRAVKKKIRALASEKKWKLERILSMKAEAAGPGTAETGDPWTAILLGKQTEPAAGEYGRITARVLLSRKDPAEGQKRYELLETRWVRQGSGWSPEPITP
jgi:hypothetical protein